MTKPNENVPSFNLWTEPWISLEGDGAVKQHSIRDALLNAYDYVAIYDPSPLVVVGIHRLLTAVLQDALNPRETSELEQLWKYGKFPADKIKRFEEKYVDRFDLFSDDKPFFQSADLPMFLDAKAQKANKPKPVAQLFPEIPSGPSLVTHYRHTTEEEQVFSSATVAAGLVAMPPFVSSGGAGLLPSINGVPPIYVLPGGKTLFESLAASLISSTMLEDDYPTTKADWAWWKRPVPMIVQESRKKRQGMSFDKHRQLREVGYLHGLTFPARKVRLHPERLNAVCSRSGQFSEWCVKTMAFRMGESVVGEKFWRDPFVAYKLPAKEQGAGGKRRLTKTKSKKKDKPNPIRPMQNRGKAAWREFTGLFLQQKDGQTLRPRFLDQLSMLSIGERHETYPFRCVAFQTDGKMKYYEWMDFGFDVPPTLLRDPDGAKWTVEALSFGTNCATTITRVFSTTFGHKTKRAERFMRIKSRMEEDYWSTLAGKFRQFILALGDRVRQQQTLDEWFNTAIHEAQCAFDRAADATGDGGSTLRQIVMGKAKCHNALQDLRNKTKQGG